MTTTNQAFIKVYRHDAAGPVPHRPAAVAEPRDSVAALGASVEFVAAATESRARSAARHTANSPLLASSIDVLPPSPQATAAFPFRFKAGLGEGARVAQPPRPAARRSDASKTGKRPLSTFLARHRSVEQIAAKPVATKVELNPTRAGTTVASFNWPAVCRAISQQCAAEFNAVIDLLLEQTTLGRSLFGILGLFPGGGCTTTALSLASRLAGDGRRAVLVDGNFFSPRIATWLDVVPTAGWQEVLENSAPMTDALIHAVNDRLDVLVQSARRPFDPLELAASRQASQSAEYLRHGYDLALVDLGAFFDPRSQAVTLELVRSMGIDAVFAVAGPQQVDPRDLAALEEHLQNSGCELLGVIENRIAS